MVDRDDILVTQEEKDRYYELVNGDNDNLADAMIKEYASGYSRAANNLDPVGVINHLHEELFLAYRVGYYDAFMDRDAKLAELTKGDFYDQDNHVKSSRLKGSEG